MKQAVKNRFLCELPIYERNDDDDGGGDSDGHDVGDDGEGDGNGRRVISRLNKSCVFDCNKFRWTNTNELNDLQREFVNDRQ